MFLNTNIFIFTLFLHYFYVKSKHTADPSQYFFLIDHSITIYTIDEREEGVSSQLYRLWCNFISTGDDNFTFRTWLWDWLSSRVDEWLNFLKFFKKKKRKNRNIFCSIRNNYFAINVSTRCDFDHLGINGSLWNALYKFSQNWSIIHLFFSLKLYHIPLVLQVPT